MFSAKLIKLTPPRRLGIASMSSAPPESSRTIKIVHLPRQVQGAALRAAFLPFGNITQLRIIPAHETKNLPPFAYITFQHASHARRAITMHNNVERITIHSPEGKQKPLKLWLTDDAEMSDPRYKHVVMWNAMSNLRPDEQLLSDTLYVGNIDYSVPVAEIRDYFGQWGDLSSVNLVKDKYGQFTGVAFIRYASEDSALACWQEVSRPPLVSRKLVVQFAKAPGSSLPPPPTDPPKRTLFVKNIDEATTPLELRRHFRHWGQVEKVEKRPITGERDYGSGFVTFVNPEDAQACCEDPKPPVFGDRILGVQYRTTRRSSFANI